MEKTTLNNSAFNLSRISLGCMSYHSLEQGRPIIERALELDINLFDTADLYDKGENERILGQVLGARRKDIFIATKVGNRWRADGSGWDWVPRKSYIRSAVRDSLRRLNTDYIDLYQLHGGTIDDPLDEVVEAFEELRSEGLIRAYGISSIRPNTIRKWTELAPRASSCMMQYSLLDRRPEEAALDHLHQHQQGVLVRGALAKGLLAGKSAKAYLGHSQEQVQAIQQQLQTATPAEDDPGCLALKYVLKHPAVSSIVLGISRAEQLKIVERLLKEGPISQQQYDDLRQLVPAQQYEQHR
jgi:aryl-alcohol dehydrogenase-like predicted oxidoreductase